MAAWIEMSAIVEKLLFFGFLWWTNMEILWLFLVICDVLYLYDTTLILKVFLHMTKQHIYP